MGGYLALGLVTDDTFDFDPADEYEASFAEYDTTAPNPGIKKRILSDQIKKLSLRESVIVSPSTPVLEVVKQMKEKHVGCALIVKGKELKGIFTERDVLSRVAIPGMHLNEIQIQEIMTPSPEVLEETDTIAFAINKMSMGNFRHVPIQKSDGSFAVVSVRDVLRYLF